MRNDFHAAWCGGNGRYTARAAYAPVVRGQTCPSDCILPGSPDQGKHCSPLPKAEGSGTPCPDSTSTYEHRAASEFQRRSNDQRPQPWSTARKLGDQLDYAVGHWTVWQTQRNSHDMQEDRVTEDVQVGHAIGQMVSTRVGEATCSFLCPECLLAFPDIPAVKKHHRTVHGRPLDKLAGQVDREKFGTGGDPTCRYCQQAFTTWPNLVKHIHDRSCPGHWQHIQNTLPCASFKAPKESHRLDDTTMHPKGGHTQGEDQSPTHHPEHQAALYDERLRSHLDKHGWPAIVDNTEICAMAGQLAKRIRNRP